MLGFPLLSVFLMMSCILVLKEWEVLPLEQWGTILSFPLTSFPAFFFPLVTPENVTVSFRTENSILMNCTFLLIKIIMLLKVKLLILVFRAASYCCSEAPGAVYFPCILCQSIILFCWACEWLNHNWNAILFSFSLLIHWKVHFVCSDFILYIDFFPPIFTLQ